MLNFNTAHLKKQVFDIFWAYIVQRLFGDLEVKWGGGVFWKKEYFQQGHILGWQASTQK